MLTAPELESNKIYWTFDPYSGQTTSESWLGLMQNRCRPVWALFGDAYQTKSEQAAGALGTISDVRGFNETSNPGGDIIFRYVNIKSIIYENIEIAGPTIATYASVFRSPTHILYVAGMEYKRFYGVLSSERIQSECDELASVMQQFRSNSGVEGCPEVDGIEESSEITWSGWESSYSPGAPEISESSTWGGDEIFTEDGSTQITEDINWNQTEVFTTDGTIGVNEQIEFDQAISVATDGSFKNEEQVEWVTQPVLALDGLLEIDEDVEWDLIPTFTEDGNPSISETTTWDQVSSPQASGGVLGTFSFGGGGGGGGILTP